ncbi:hypothetical protein BU16DRAFT_229397 [Lophium mytilinum]|uniref:C2 domain-containing protein n=1 Tax=Lophium mytilinum TaxID=390894 RepID=A0A6A6Q7I9_9PEZI|nr:hypothetical protein BU16DRAFT_229397 [Lophium mytilinum]
MALKATKLAAFGGMHTAGIFSDMTVDGPEIGTLVVIVDRAKNLPNRRTMGKQDPYCAARLGKEAKKTDTDKRGGQTPKWDQELRFTVHDSPDYYTLKVSVFNDDKKTELIGETFITLEEIIVPGGGQSDVWHNLNCKGKYAGEVRIELTYYDTRPKPEKAPVERRRESARTGGVDGQSPAVGGPRESTPVKRRPLPSDPTSASPSPAAIPEHRGLPTGQAGPRSYNTPPRQQSAQSRPHEHTPTVQRRNQYQDQHAQSADRRRQYMDASPLNPRASSSALNTPQSQSRGTRPSQYESYGSASSLSLNDNGERYENPQELESDLSYTAPKSYEVQASDLQSSNPRPLDNRMSMFPQDFRSSTEALQTHHTRPQSYMDLPHSHSAPVVPSYQPSVEQNDFSQGRHQHRSDEYDQGHGAQHVEDYRHPSEPYNEPRHQIEPLRIGQYQSHGHDFSNDQISPHRVQHQEPTSYAESHHSYNPYEFHGRPTSAMQPTVEDEDDMPPPPPVHRSSAPAVPQYEPQRPPSYREDAPAPLNIVRYQEPRPSYDLPNSYEDRNDYAPSPLSSDRRNTHPRASMSPNPQSQPDPQEAYSMPSSLVAGYNTSVVEHRTPPHQRGISHPSYGTPPTYETPTRPHPLAQQESTRAIASPSYYAHSSPQEPLQTYTQDPAPMIKPRAVSPAARIPIYDDRSRGPSRSTPTRKSVSPRPPPSSADVGERRLSAVPFGPDDFNELNPVTRNNGSYPDGQERGNEVNDKGQIVTFNGRVIDASDHLPVDSWAPEPERKGAQKDRPVRERVGLRGARDLEAAMQRERDRKERDRIRNAVNGMSGHSSVNASPSSALTLSRNANSMGPVSTDANATSPTSRNRLQKRDKRPVSAVLPPSHSPGSHIPSPNTSRLYDLENRGYGGSPGYRGGGGAGARNSIAGPPPIPAKIPLAAGEPADDMSALSMELSSIDIGGGRRAVGRRRNY